MKTYLVPTVLLIVISCWSMAAGQLLYRPGWVLYHLKHQEYLLADTAYVGIGASGESQSAADDDAYKRFAASVETYVLSISERTIKEQKDEIRVDRYEVTNQVVTEVSLRGVTVTDRYYDPEFNLYYSLVSYNKDDYADMVVEEFNRWLQAELEKKIVANRVREKEMLEDERHRQKTHDILMQMRRNRRKRLAESLAEYREFLKEPPPHRVVTIRNGEQLDDAWELIGRMGIAPFSFEGGGVAMGFWKRMELSGKFNVLGDNLVQWQESSLRLQLLDQSGKFNKLSLAFGVVEYDAHFYKTFKELADNDTHWNKPDFSPLITGNITVPTMQFSYLSFYFDYRKIVLGINSYIFYDYFGQSISLIGQVDLIQDVDYRVNNHNNAFLFQPAIRFEPDPSLIATFSYEDHRRFIFTLDLLIR